MERMLVEVLCDLRVPLVAMSVPAGFPSPAEDYLDKPLDFNELIIANPAATFAVRVDGDSMIGAGIHPGDIAVVVLERTARELKGEPCQELELVNPPSKSICASRSFGAEQTAFVPVSEAVATFVARGSEKLRRQQLVAGTVSVFLETNTFKAVKQYHPWATVSLPVASADIRTLTTAAQNALRMIFKQGYRYKKAGVLLDDLSAAGCVQGDFWSEPDSPQSQALMRAMDRLNKVWGRGTVKTASCGTRETWRLRADLMSRRYTTRWDELLRVT